MRIGLVADTFSLEVGTGIARYCQELLTGLSRLGLDVQPLYFPQPNLPFRTVVHHVVKMPYLVSKRAKSFDLIHATSPVCAFGFPMISRLKVVTYHDLVALLCGNTNIASYAQLLAPLTLRVGRFADQVIADSSQTKAQIITCLRIPDDKITVVNLGVDERFIPMEKAKEQDQYIIGYVGALDRRKRLDYLLRAFHLLKRRWPIIPARLVICGGKGGEYSSWIRLATELSIDGDVEFRGFVSEEVLVRTYNSFDVFVLPSELEGFGLPILEAQRCGVPVVICEDARIPREVSQACLKAGSEEDMADRIYYLLTDPGLRSLVVQEGLEHSRQFTWNKTVQEVLAVYEELLP
jgi:glycosyltransferase involved in cell wall biosynthesis